VVHHGDDVGAGLDLALLENIARQDLTPLDEARAFARLIDSGLTRKGVAERLSVPQKRVTEQRRIPGIRPAAQTERQARHRIGVKRQHPLPRARPSSAIVPAIND